MALGACGFFVYYWWTATDRTVSAFGVSLCLMALGCAAYGVNSLWSHIVIEPDAVVIKDAISTRRIERSDIGGAREVYVDSQRGTELWLYDKSGQRIFVPHALGQKLLGDTWAEGIEDLDQRDINRVNASFATDERLGDSEAERRWNGSTWLGRTNFLNLLAIPVGLMALGLGDDAPLPWPLFLIIAAMPILAVGINVVTDGAVDLHSRANDDGPNVQALSWSPLVLFWRSFDVQGGHWGSAWMFGFCLSIPVTYWLTRWMREAGHSLNTRGPVTFLLVAMYFASVILLVKDHRAQVRYERMQATENVHVVPDRR
ncbi:hypothetical protein Y886_14665 [Xanthomonas hyacinthi DSM 19077]|nr:hypothetical protein Y886_14665 [Xanthomonas hyacinthi DSM 19077]